MSRARSRASRRVRGGIDRASAHRASDRPGTRPGQAGRPAVPGPWGCAGGIPDRAAGSPADRAGRGPDGGHARGCQPAARNAARRAGRQPRAGDQLLRRRRPAAPARRRALSLARPGAAGRPGRRRPARRRGDGGAGRHRPIQLAVPAARPGRTRAADTTGQASACCPARAGRRAGASLAGRRRDHHLDLERPDSAHAGLACRALPRRAPEPRCPGRAPAHVRVAGRAGHRARSRLRPVAHPARLPGPARGGGDGDRRARHIGSGPVCPPAGAAGSRGRVRIRPRAGRAGCCSCCR